MLYKTFNCRIDSAFTRELAEFLSQEGKKTIYLKSKGGEYDEGVTAVHMINTQKEDITLVGVGALYSAAFGIFYGVDCPKELAEGCKGMWHQPNIEVTLDGMGRLDNPCEKQASNGNKDVYKEILKIAKKLKFSKKEMKKFKKNYYVYFRHKRMKELFNK